MDFNPHDDELRYWLAFAVMQQRRFEEAESLLDRLLEEQPDSPFPYLGKARLASLRREGPEKQMALALESYRRLRWDLNAVVKRELATFFVLDAAQHPKALALLDEAAGAKDAWALLLL